MKNQYLVTAFIALIVGVGAFYGGIQYQKSKVPAFAQNFRGGNGQRVMPNNGGANGQGNRMMNRFQIGEVVSTDDQSMTVKYPDGTSKLIILSQSTTFNKASEGNKNDLQPGTKVVVMGTTNNDGSETAQSIQINPTQRPN